MDTSAAVDQASIAEAKSLVHELSNPVDVSKIQQVQARLQEVQKSSGGWIIADALLNSEDQHDRFFGALTFTIKIHQDWKQLSDGDANELLGRLVGHFILLVNKGDKSVVIRKLASTLVAFFLQPEAPWTQCVRSLVISMANGRYIPEDTSDLSQFETTSLPSLQQGQVLSVLSFASTLAEEAVKHHVKDLPSTNLGRRVESNVQDAFFLVEFVLRHVMQQLSAIQDPAQAEPMAELGTEAIKLFHSWLNTSRAIKPTDPVTPAGLTPLIDLIILSLARPGLSIAAMEFLVEVLKYRASVLSKDHVRSVLEYLISDHGEAHSRSLLSGEYEDESKRFLDLLLAYSRAEQKDILTGTPTEQNRKILFLLHVLFSTPGLVEFDGHAVTILLEFWAEAADNLNDMLMESVDEAVLQRSKTDLMQVVGECYPNLLYPEPEVVESWDDEERARFGGLRRDFADYLLLSFPLLGLELVKQLAEKASSSIANGQWQSFEVAIFCISHLSEAIDEAENADNILVGIMGSDMFTNICSGSIDIPMRLRQTLVDMLGNYTTFLERKKDILPHALNFLFTSLNIPLCAHAASRAISTLCQSCRHSLTRELGTFLVQFEKYRSQDGTPVNTLERVLEGVSAVIQALPSDSEKVASLSRLLQPLRDRAGEARMAALQNDFETAREIGSTVLRCVASIGRGVRTLDDFVIDLDSGEGDDTKSTNNFWSEGYGGAPQAFTIEIFGILTNDFPVDHEMIEAACDVLKAGYTESKPGSFTFPPQFTVDFVRKARVDTPRVDVVMNTASAFLASHASNTSKIHNETISLIQHLYEIISLMTHSPQQNDPEISYSGIDFLTRLLPKYNHIFFSLATTTDPTTQPIVPTLLDFTLLSLQGPDPLPLRSAAQFWVAMLNLPTQVEAQQPQPPPIQSILQTYLPHLSHILIRQIAGGCSRSDLSHLSEVIKRFVFKHPGIARTNLGGALEGLEPPVEGGGGVGVRGVSKQDRERFLGKVLAARGARSTNVVVRDFWIACMGRGFAYTE
ncbi:hypothetical protein FQN54_001697 [Arachnomyces sp. PD_36]|nr:hypothetical protein FQN54_001697 [Arachnomyces sp. PD_36]